MKSLTVYLFFAALACTNATTPTQPIKWFPCTQKGAKQYTCGTLTVPLDYSDPKSTETLELKLVKANATKTPCKGSILINPGGPGEDGRNFVAGAESKNLLAGTGGHFDIISFDPRGTGDTLPVSCYKSEAERAVAGLLTAGSTNASDVALGNVWAAKTTVALSCAKNIPKIGELVGTAFVARDMLRIVDALGEDRMLRYWGFSYGTILGMTFAAMFPDRVGRMVIDGVVNPHEYYAGPTPEQLLETDITLAGFFSGCVAAPKQCALATPGATAKSLSAQFYSFLNNLKYNPLVVGPDISTSVIRYETVQNVMFQALYNPSLWPSVATLLHGLYTKNYTEALEGLAAQVSGAPSPFPVGNAGEALAAIQGSDSAFRATSVEELVPVVNQYYANSKFAGDSYAKFILTYAQWKFQAKERYTGNFRVKTRNPLLVVGSPYDPATSLASAKNASAGFAGSVVLQQNGYGHTSLAQISACTFKAVAEYFSSGKLPKAGTQCQPSEPLFAPPSSKSKTKRASSEVAELSTALKAFNRHA